MKRIATMLLTTLFFTGGLTMKQELAVAQPGEQNVSQQTAPAAGEATPAVPVQNTETETPDMALRASADAAQSKEVIGATKLSDKWKAFVALQGWPAETTENGVIHVQDKIIAAARVSVNVRPGQPGWVESRIAAFERAELDAKAKIISSLVETITTQRSLGVLEGFSAEDGDIHKLEQLKGVAATLDRIGKKSLELTETSLDTVLRDLDPDYDPEKYKNQTPENLHQIAENNFKREVQRTSMKTLIGIIPIYSAEGKVSETEYQVLVGVIWSPKLNRLALSLSNGEYNIPPVAPGKPLNEYLPQDDDSLLGTMGAKIVVDEKGNYTVLSYGQAQPRRAAVGRELAAVQDATQVAAGRARAAIVNFVEESLVLKDREKSEEVSREFSDGTFGTESIRDYQRIIQGKRVQVKLSGLQILKEWSVKHPETGQTVAGAIVAWSPSSAQISQAASAVMDAQSVPDPQSQGTPQPNQEGKTLESMQVDTSAY